MQIGRGAQKKNVDIFRPCCPLKTHTSCTPHSVSLALAQFGLFWLSLKHMLTIAGILPVPHPFFCPFCPILFILDRCWDR